MLETHDVARPLLLQNRPGSRFPDPHAGKDQLRWMGPRTGPYPLSNPPTLPPHCLLACAVPLCSQLQTSQMNRSRSWRFLDLPPSALHRSSQAECMHARRPGTLAVKLHSFSPHNAPPRPSSTTARVRKVKSVKNTDSPRRPSFATRQSASIGL